MRGVLKGGLCMMIVLVLAMISTTAATLEISMDAQVLQGVERDINFSVNGDPIDGIVEIGYDNLNGSSSAVAFVSTDFVGRFVNFTLQVKGNEPGEYHVFANVSNLSTGEVITSKNLSGDVNGSMPQVIEKSPKGTVPKQEHHLVVETDEESNCKFDTSDRTYQNLSTEFSETDSTLHNHTLGELGEGIHTYFVRCKDNEGYEMNESEIVEFTVNFRPTAEIELVVDNPPFIPEGTIEVNVETSEELDDPPELYYTFDDEPTKKHIISLEGENRKWNGFMIIEEVDDNKAGKFSLKAIDNAGNIGTKITEGSIFVVDTTKPPAPVSVKAETKDSGRIELTWYYDGEEPEYYRIYRGTKAGLKFVDYYDTANSSEFYLDRKTFDKVSYYYKVTAIDKAGNEGPLSQEVFATALYENGTGVVAPVVEDVKEEEVPKVLPPDLHSIVDDFVKKIDQKIIDFDQLAQDLAANSGDKLELIKELKLVEKVKSGKAKLETLKGKVEGFKDSYATKEELNGKLDDADLELKKLDKTTPKDASIIEESQFLQSIGKEDIEIVVADLFRDEAFTEDEKKEYVKKNVKEQNKIKVDVGVTVTSVEYLDGSVVERSIIKKKLSYQVPEVLRDIIVIEKIPVSVAGNINDVVFEDSFETLTDNAAKFGFLEFDSSGEEISYTVDKRVNVEDVKDAKSILLLSLNELIGTGGGVTGLSIFSLSGLGLSGTQSVFVWLGVVVIVGLLVYYFFFIKDYKYVFRSIGRKKRVKRLEKTLDVNQVYGHLSKMNVLDDGSKTYKVEDDAHPVLHQFQNNVKEVKADIADKLMPMFMSLSHKIKPVSAGSSMPEPEEPMVMINRLIDQAHVYIDHNLYNKGESLYPQIQILYQSLNADERSEVYERCLSLHNRIKGS